MSELKSKALDFLGFLGWLSSFILAIAFAGFALKILHNIFMLGWELI